MGFEEESLETTFSDSKWRNWKESQSCQPNFWTVNFPYLLRIEFGSIKIWPRYNPLNTIHNVRTLFLIQKHPVAHITPKLKQ